MKAIGAAILRALTLLALTLLAFTGLLAGEPAFAQAKQKAGNQAKEQTSGADRTLLATFCDAANIKGSTCKRAKGYSGNRRCDVKLSPDRYSGKFLAAGQTILAVAYESGCEPHATDFGGSVLFEQAGDGYRFKGYQPGYQVNDCVVIPRNDKQDRLICVTSHLGQGRLESGVAEMVFTQDFSKDISLSMNYFMTAEDATGAYGSNVVECKEASKYFGVSKPGTGPGRDTVAVDAAYADKDTIQTACTKGFPRPKEIFGELAPGEAYVPPGHEKKARFVIDLQTSRVVPAAEFGKP